MKSPWVVAGARSQHVLNQHRYLVLKNLVERDMLLGRGGGERVVSYLRDVFILYKACLLSVEHVSVLLGLNSDEICVLICLCIPSPILQSF